MIEIQEFENYKKQFGLHKKAKVTDLPVKILVENFSEKELISMILLNFTGNHFDALKNKNKDLYNKWNHIQWDLTLSYLSGTRCCGISNTKCPFPLEEEINFISSIRKDIKLYN